MKNNTYLCPNKNCKFHFEENTKDGIKWYRSHGYYSNKLYGKIPRYICKNCGTTFTMRTYNEDRYLHNVLIDSEAVYKKWIEGAEVAELAREYNCTQSMVRTRIQRVARITQRKNY